MSFRFTQQSAHFTYRGHIAFEVIKQLFDSIGQVLWFSFVHESSDQEVQYDHTHAAVRWSRRPDRINPRFADIGGVHPHIQPIRSAKHACEIYDKYHHKDPVALLQSEERPAKPTTIETIQGANSLYDACTDLAIVPRTVSDVLALRRDKPKPPAFTHSYRDTVWTLPLLHAFKVLYVYGPSGTGKTQWAVHCFDSPLVVSHMDGLRDFDPNEHDGIVFDDMSFGHHPRESVIHLLDWDLERQIHCRYNCARIPMHTRKIFTSNLSFDECFPSDSAGAIRRRVTKIIHVTGPTYEARNMAPEEPDGHRDAAILASPPRVGESPLQEQHFQQLEELVGHLDADQVALDFDVDDLLNDPVLNNN